MCYIIKYRLNCFFPVQVWRNCVLLQTHTILNNVEGIFEQNIPSNQNKVLISKRCILQGSRCNSKLVHSTGFMSELRTQRSGSTTCYLTCLQLGFWVLTQESPFFLFSKFSSSGFSRVSVISSLSSIFRVPNFVFNIPNTVKKVSLDHMSGALVSAISHRPVKWYIELETPSAEFRHEIRKMHLFEV